ncbi:MAG: adenylate/guanylate cyclase domain-containing protein [Syntrophobacteraceae bacterium]
MNAYDLIALLLSITALALFVAAVHLRWFSRFRRGFLVTLTIALVGTGLASSLLVGIWGFKSAKQIISEEGIKDLEWVGGLVEKEFNGEVKKSLTQMSELSALLAPSIEHNDLDEVKDESGDFLRINRRFIQVDVYDKSGRLMAAIGSGNATESINRVAVAFALDGRSFISDPYRSTVFGRHVLYLCVPVKSPEGEVIGSLSTLLDLEEALSTLLTSTQFGESGYIVLVDHDGLILAHPDRARAREDVSMYRAVQAGLKGESGSLVDLNRAGQKRLFFYRPVKGLGSINPKPMILISEMDEREALSPLYSLRFKLVSGTVLIALACLAIAQQLSRYIKRPFEDLLHMVEQVQAGDLSVRAHTHGRDEIGQLGAALNGMVEGLRERDVVKEIFGRYVTTQVSDEVLKGNVNLGGESRRVTILFSDIRNFTAMSEQMEPTQVVDFLNDYFSEMVEAVFEYGGVLDKFMGDGMLAVFGSFGDAPDHPRRGVMAALRMKALLGKINGKRSIMGKPPINIGVGIHTDEVIVGNIGSYRRLEYTVIGDGVNTTARLESLNKVFDSTILITSSTYEEVSDLFECRLMPEAQIRGKTKVMTTYEVLSIKS